MDHQKSADTAAEQSDGETDGGPSQSINRRSVLAGVGGIGTSGALLASTSRTAQAHTVPDHLAETPPMGWNSWNTFACDINAELIKDTADAMVESGMKEAGYEYVNIDDCWMAERRDENGHLQPHPERFPNGIAPVADYVHERGLKLGIYESAGSTTCQGYPGSLRHEETDARSFADWGVDYLKYDNCGDHFGMDARTRYDRMWDALDATGRDVVKSQCSWGIYESWKTWAKDIGSNLWRTTFDIFDDWSRVMEILDQQVGLAQYAEPGHWNDPDMLEVGNPGLSVRESRAHFSLWCILNAPLIAGNDLRDMSGAERDILTNEEAIAINQDWAGSQGTKRKDTGEQEVWAKPLSNGDVAVCLLNRDESTSLITVSVDKFDLQTSDAYILRDLWDASEVAADEEISAAVPPHDVAFYRVRPGSPNEAPPATRLTFDASDVTVDEGETVTVTTSLTNSGPIPIEDVTLSLDPPEGWEITAIGSRTYRTVQPSSSVGTDWEITAPPDATAGWHELSLAASFTWGDSHETATTHSEGRVRVPLDPVPAEYSTFASTEARFGSIESLGRLVISANGTDVWNSYDEYGAMYRADVDTNETSTAVTKVRSQEHTNEWAKAGLMTKNDITEAGSSAGYAIVAVTPGNGFTFQYDSTGDGYLDTAATTGETTYPCWMRLETDGSTVTGSYSTDGDTWHEIGAADLESANEVLDVGMFSTAHADDTLGTVEFDEFYLADTPELTLSRDTDIVPRGETTALTTTFTNTTGSTIRDVTLAVTAPNGWNVGTSGRTSFSEVSPGESVSAVWEARAGSSVETGEYTFTASATYTQNERTRTVTGSTSLTVPPAPPTSDTSLSEHPWVSATIGWGDIGIDESVGGNPLTIGGTTFEYGLGTHARSEITYYLGGTTSRFTATVGIDDEVGTRGSVRFRVVGDGEVLYETDVLTGGMEPVPLDVAIADVEVLTLVVTNGGDDIDFDHADWALATVHTDTADDLDGDGDFEDLTGDGAVTRADLEAYAERIDDPAFRAKVEKFDYNENGRIDHADLVELWQEL